MERVSTDPPGELDGRTVTHFDTTDGLRFTLEDGGWLLVRFSGTEPVMRIYAESESLDRVGRLLEEGKKLAGV